MFLTSNDGKIALAADLELHACSEHITRQLLHLIYKQTNPLATIKLASFVGRTLYLKKEIVLLNVTQRETVHPDTTLNKYLTITSRRGRG